MEPEPDRIEVKDFDKICRICFERNDPLKFHQELDEFYQTYFGITADEEGKLPNRVCGKCEFDLDLESSFIAKCKKNEAFLWEVYLASNVKQEETLTDIRRHVSVEDNSSLEMKKPASVPMANDKARKRLAKHHIRIEDFDKICRICFKRNHLHKFQADQLQFYESFFRIAPDQEGKLPHNICEKCEFDLESALTFISKCKKHEKLLWEVCFSDKVKPEETPIDITHNDLTEETTVSKLPPEEINEATSVPTAHDEGPKAQKMCYVKLEKLNIQNHMIPEEPTDLKKTKKKSKSRLKVNQCYICKKILSSQGNLTKHIIRHDNSENVESKRNIIRIHKRRFRCYTCGKSFTDKRNLRDHAYAHMAIRPDDHTYKCRNCNKSFKSIRDLKTHLYEHDGKQTFPCSQCDKVFVTRSILKVHLRRHSSVRAHDCDACKKSFKTAQTLKTHQDKHCAGTRNHKCPCCFKVFDSVITFREHMDKHTEEKLFKCSTCGNSYKRNADLTVHKEKHSVKRFTCYDCGKSYPTRSSLLHHLRIHTAERRFKCPYCDKAFTAKSTCEHHIRTHTGERPYKCPSCKNTYAHSNLLKEHIRSHTGERPYKCSECGKDFISNSELYHHKKSHDEKRHKCTHCDEGFARSFDLKVHLCSHTGEKVYECYICDKAYLSAGSLKVHKATHKKKV